MHISVLVFKAFLGLVNGHLGDNNQVLETKGREWRTESMIQFYSHKNWLQIQERTFGTFFVPKNEPEKCLDGSN